MDATLTGDVFFALVISSWLAVPLFAACVDVLLPNKLNERDNDDGIVADREYLKFESKKVHKVQSD